MKARKYGRVTVNLITKTAVYNTSLEHKTAARKSAEGVSQYVVQFHNHVSEEYWGLVMNDFGANMRLRAEQKWRFKRPDMFEVREDGEDGELDYYFDYTCFSPSIERWINKKIENDPTLQLQEPEEYHNYLMTLFPVQMTMEI